MTIGGIEPSGCIFRTHMSFPPGKVVAMLPQAMKQPSIVAAIEWRWSPAVIPAYDFCQVMAPDPARRRSWPMTGRAGSSACALRAASRCAVVMKPRATARSPKRATVRVYGVARVAHRR